MRQMKWLPVLVGLVLEFSTFASAQSAGSSRDRAGLGNMPASGLGRSADKALPLVEPDARRTKSQNKLDDWNTRNPVNPLIGRRR